MNSPPTGMNHDDVQSALESLRQMLVEHKRKANPGRVLAFSKRLASLSLALLHNGTIPALTTLRSIILVRRTYGLGLDFYFFEFCLFFCVFICVCLFFSLFLLLFVCVSVCFSLCFFLFFCFVFVFVCFLLSL